MKARNLNIFISRTLRIGIYISGALMLIGLSLAAIHPPEPKMLSWSIYPALFSRGLIPTLINPYFYIISGILTLLLTPIVRVIITFVSFTIEKDWRYVFISFVVLTIILASVFISFIR